MSSNKNNSGNSSISDYNADYREFQNYNEKTTVNKTIKTPIQGDKSYIFTENKNFHGSQNESSQSQKNLGWKNRSNNIYTKQHDADTLRQASILHKNLDEKSCIHKTLDDFSKHLKTKDANIGKIQIEKNNKKSLKDKESGLIKNVCVKKKAHEIKNKNQLIDDNKSEDTEKIKRYISQKKCKKNKDTEDCENNQSLLPLVQMRPKTSKYNYLRNTFAVIFLLFALTGTAFIAYENKGKQIEVVSLFSNEKSDYEKYLTSLVMYDPKPFENINQADQNTLISAGVWRALMCEKIKEFDDQGLGVLSFETMLNFYKELFGKDIKLEIKENIDNPLFFFNVNEKTFHIKPYSTQNCFIPFIEEIINNNDFLVLKVGYVSPSDPWRSLNDTRPSDPTPTKHMYYKLKKNKTSNELCITSISDSHYINQ